MYKIVRQLNIYDLTSEGDDKTRRLYTWLHKTFDLYVYKEDNDIVIYKHRDFNTIALLIEKSNNIAQIPQSEWTFMESYFDFGSSIKREVLSYIIKKKFNFTNLTFYRMYK